MAAAGAALLPPLSASEAARVRQRVYQLFTRLHGLSVPMPATDYLVDVFRVVPPNEIDATLTLIIQAYQQQETAVGSLVDQVLLQQVVQGMIRRQTGDPLAELRRRLEVINVFDVPSYHYSPERRTFTVAAAAPKLHGGAGSKAEYLRERYLIHKQRLLRHAMFAPPVSGADPDSALKLTPIQALVGARSNCIVFGYLAQRKEGMYVLEDPDAFVELDLRQATTGEGLFTEGSCVLAEGDFADGVLVVRVLGLPPAETITETRRITGHINLFGGQKQHDSLATLRDIEAEAEDAALLVLSDVWLDQPLVLDALRTLLQRVSDTRLLGIVLMGSFVSEPVSWNGEAAQQARAHFAALADVVATAPALANGCPLVLVPSLHDVGLADVLPRPPLPATVLERLRAKVNNLVLASNPCRIRFCTKEIVIFREELVNKLRRNCVVPPSDPSLSLAQQAVRTVVDSAHLCPLALSVRPIYWGLDHTLRLFPLPHALVLGDRCDRFEERRAECHCLNPGPFAAPDFGYLLYYPAAERATFGTVTALSSEPARAP